MAIDSIPMTSVTQPAAAVTGAPPPSLRGRALRGAAWIAVGTLARHALKLASSLILTRILAPEAFGLMATLGVLMAGVEMCSDFGLRQALIQHPEGSSRRLLDTAWTLVLVRGVVLSMLLGLLAWPFALLFEQPQLFELALLCALLPLIRDLASPDVLRWNRELDQRRLTLVELGGEVLRIIASIAAAWWTGSAIGLAIGALVGEAARSAGSYAAGGAAPRWSIDRAVARSLFGFGRFVFVSSLIGFLALRLDALFVARFLGMQQAGLYYIAGVFALMLDTLGSSIAGQILFPALAQRQDNPDLMRRVVGLVLEGVGLLLAACVAIAAAAPFIISLLYTNEYDAAAHPLRWLILAAGVSTFANTVNGPLMASGHPQYGTVATMVRLVAFCATAPLLGARWGAEGYAAAVLLATVAFAGVLAWAACREGHVRGAQLAGVWIAPACLAAVLWAARSGLPAHEWVRGACAGLGLAAVLYWKHGPVLELLRRRRAAA